MISLLVTDSLEVAVVEDSECHAQRRRAVDILRDADAVLVTQGVIVWRIAPTDGRDTVVVDYEDTEGNGLPEWLLAKLADFPVGTVDLRPVSGPTQTGALRPPG